MFKLLVIVAVCCIQTIFCANVCPCGWTNINNKCYKFFSTKSVTWNVARSSCQRIGGDLAIISNLKDSVRLAFEAQKRGLTSSWIGYFRPRYQSHKFLSVCGVTPTCLNWAPGEPNDEAGGEGCGQLYTSGSRAGKWNDKECYHSLHYICEFSYLRCN